jgi:hypothetical protein
MYSRKRRLRLFRDPAFNNSFVNPTLNFGSAVTTVSQSPFVGGGRSYSLSASTNSYIMSPGSVDWTLGTGDFTVEWFGYQTTLAGAQRPYSVGTYSSAITAVSIESNGSFYYWANGPYRFVSSSASTANTWIHWAVVRRSGTTTIYRNGTQLGSSFSDTYDLQSGGTVALVVGNETTYSNNAGFVGYLTNFRFVKGLAVYTGNFTVPTSALTGTASANPYGGSNTVAIGEGFTKLLLVP